MIKKRLTLPLLFAASLIGPATAACPPPMAGETAAAIEANQQRLVCLQRELAQSTEQHQFKVEINSLDRTIQQIQLERRFDTLSFPKSAAPGF